MAKLLFHADRRVLVTIALAALASTTPAIADPVADFYAGKTVRMIIRAGVGGGYDQYSRLLARFIGKHIPGNPAVLPVNMPGGGGIVAANYVAQVAPISVSRFSASAKLFVLDVCHVTVS